MVMKIEPKDDIELAIWDEIETLNENIEIVASLLKDENIPFLVGKNAEELLTMLIQIKNIFKDKNEKIEKKVAILEKLPLLYLQISFIKQQIKSGVSA
ncbi:MAG: hypothetical protein RBT22_12195 [Aliarcobacter sp.]|jgi:hypothetical protein|nr:hypothetical protein [Aliarcobacter sp.]